MTRRWREMDSNLRYPAKFLAALSIPAQFTFRNITGSLAPGTDVRIHLPQRRVCEPSVSRAYRGWASRLSVTMRQVITPVAAPGCTARECRAASAVLDRRRRRRPPQRRRAQIPADPRATSGWRPRKPSCHPFADVVRIAGPPDVKIRNAARAR